MGRVFGVSRDSRGCKEVSAMECSSFDRNDESLDDESEERMILRQML